MIVEYNNSSNIIAMFKKYIKQYSIEIYKSNLYIKILTLEKINKTTIYLPTASIFAALDARNLLTIRCSIFTLEIIKVIKNYK